MPRRDGAVGDGAGLVEQIAHAYDPDHVAETTPACDNRGPAVSGRDELPQCGGDGQVGVAALAPRTPDATPILARARYPDGRRH